ncbi:alpha-2-macroglobulin family protein [Methanococcoides burtonii]|uniref:Protease inhibitor, alpha(2)-macroglobulin-like protein n=1 Tax=Methanococcoides burtonii (strain DSM 6242 / NBRC 107633 / OCM 468 / ACE-M) TaxID=259564 RepID=Q12VC6_METBU|nr:alpha-2-macroglobulin family protein [Methanococcoides burtonii]ABE52600.1 protease inhibitor, alpha(2)-macroglobulin -like protein [Methanococcoides burtonii DSM 6242]
MKYNGVTKKGFCLLVLLSCILLAGCIGQDDGNVQTSSNEALSYDEGGTYSEEDEYLVLVPKALFSGGESSVTMSAFLDDEPVSRGVEYTLTSAAGDIIPLVKAATSESGNNVAKFDVPDVEEGSYTLTATPSGAESGFTTTVKVMQNNPIFIETDKPIYKPGQIIHVRLLSLNNNLIPVVQNTTVEIADAKGVKIYKDDLVTNEYGVAFFDLPLASELNLGTWKVKATSGSSMSEVDIRVEKYVLPKFDLETSTEKSWFLADEPITGTVSANYFFGKVVEGTVEVKASRYVGVWEEYSTSTATLKDGNVEFTLPAVGYVAGTFGAGGQGSVMLNVTVTDTGGNSEESTELLTIAEHPFIMQMIPESNSIKPGMPLQVLLVTKDPGGEPLEKEVTLVANFRDDNYNYEEIKETYTTETGIALVTLEIPEDAVSVELSAASEKVKASSTLNSVYSPSASFLHLSQVSEGIPEVGDVISFKVYSTNAGTVFYDVFANGRTVYSATSDEPQINILVTPQMSPSAKVVAYLINPNNEVSADSLPFDVKFSTQVDLSTGFDEEMVAPGDAVSVELDAGTKSMIGLSIVDESVYALSEGRLNLKQVFDELEIRFMEPRVEAHPQYFGYQTTAYDVLDDAGMIVLASGSLEIPRSQTNDAKFIDFAAAVFEMDGMEVMDEAVMEMPREEAAMDDEADSGEQLAEVERVRQFFPETWIWMPEILTDDNGLATLDLNAPDSITKWRLHAVSSGPEGIGISEAGLTVFQDFFIDPDLPYAVIRGEEFPVQVQVYNYLDMPQNVKLTLSGAEWFELVGDDVVEVGVDANSVTHVSFTIRPTRVGVQTVELTGQTTEKADAIRKTIIVEAEGVTREIVDNGILKNGTVELDATLPDAIVPDSEKVILSFTPSIVAQTISGVDDLLGMPYGCGEQNMMLFSTDVEVLRYLKATGQQNPEVQAKALTFITTGYQRELTFMHSDGSFSAFGESDGEGSLWLTSFVLSQFSGARDLTTIDENIVREAAEWIGSYQKEDGSWEAVGFVIHEDMMGGVSGTYALTAYVTLALDEYGYAAPIVMENARSYLEAELDKQDDPYALAIGTLALQKLESDRADESMEKLLELAKEDENGVYWGYDDVMPEPYEYGGYGFHPISSKNVETTAYATLALIETNDPRASSSLKWIAAQRNSNGGFSSTQDTVMAFRALMTAAAVAGRDVDATVTVSGDGVEIKGLRITSENYDVVNIIEVPEGVEVLEMELSGSGELNYQLVRRFNVILPEIIEHEQIELDVEYDSTDVEVDDVVKVDVRLKYNGMPGIRGVIESSGMMIVDIAVPTGFTPVGSSLEALKEDGTITRYEIAGRKIILYIDEMMPGEEMEFSLNMRAMFPVKAMVQESSAYSYYNPEVKAEVKGMNVTVV